MTKPKLTFDTIEREAVNALGCTTADEALKLLSDPTDQAAQNEHTNAGPEHAAWCAGWHTHRNDDYSIDREGLADALDAIAETPRTQVSNPCQCEHEVHFDGNPGHAYATVPSGSHQAHFVGPICDECATTHYAKMLRTEA